MAHSLAGTRVKAENLIDVASLVKAYYEGVPQPTKKGERVSFGTSGHRGISWQNSFTDAHVAAITQAICDGRKQFGATGLCFVGQDTHALSQPAYQTVLEVLAGNGIIAGVDCHGEFVPTPSVSRAIIRHNVEAKHKADGIIITPSHNPPEHGGIKYNPINGGPADTTITKWIEERANQYLMEQGKGIKRLPKAQITADLQKPYDFRELYVRELPEIIDMKAIQKANPHILIDALGGSGAAYWQRIAEVYGLDLTIVHGTYDPTFSFMAYDHDGAVRMDCSSPYAMAEVIKRRGEYDLAIGNDPDYDRYGIVTEEGLLAANHFLAVAGAYLFSTRSWDGKGIGKSLVVTQLIDRWAEVNHIPVYEVPVGFKFFAPLLFAGAIGLAGEESAGGSFLKKDGTVWTTDKDGIVMGLLAMEIFSVTGHSPGAYYTSLTKTYGNPCYARCDAPCSKEAKEVLKKLAPKDVTAKYLNGEKITDIRTTSLHGEIPIEGLRLGTSSGWVVARPSGTEDLYKIYGESFAGEAALAELLEEGQALVAATISKV